MSRFYGYVCRKCGARVYPRHWRCPSCGATELETVPLEGIATLLTFTRIYMLSLAFHERFITLGIVEFENGLRALGKLLVEEPRVGMKLEVTTGTVRVDNGNPIEGLCFCESSEDRLLTKSQ